jgi:hypothetical protein
LRDPCGQPLLTTTLARIVRQPASSRTHPPLITKSAAHAAPAHRRGLQSSFSALAVRGHGRLSLLLLLLRARCSSSPLARSPQIEPIDRVLPLLPRSHSAMGRSLDLLRCLHCSMASLLRPPAGELDLPRPGHGLCLAYCHRSGCWTRGLAADVGDHELDRQLRGLPAAVSEAGLVGRRRARRSGPPHRIPILSEEKLCLFCGSCSSAGCLVA